jgi:hypothetical protein
MSGLDEQIRDFLVCKKCHFEEYHCFWKGEYYDFKENEIKKIYFNTDKYIKQATVFPVPIYDIENDYDAVRSGRNASLGEILETVNIECGDCGHKATHEESELIKRVAKRKIRDSK